MGFSNLESARASRIACYRNGFDFDDEADRTAALSWTVGALGAMYDALNDELRSVATELRKISEGS